MGETDSIRLARMEEKQDALRDSLNAWMDRVDERHENTCKDVRALQADIAALKLDRARVQGAVWAGRVVAAFIGGAVGAIVSLFTGGKH